MPPPKIPWQLPQGDQRLRAHYPGQSLNRHLARSGASRSPDGNTALRDRKPARPRPSVRPLPPEKPLDQFRPSQDSLHKALRDHQDHALRSPGPNDDESVAVHQLQAMTPEFHQCDRDKARWRSRYRRCARTARLSEHSVFLSLHRVYPKR